MRASHRTRRFRPALARHSVTLNRHHAEGQQRLRSCVWERAINGDAVLPDFRAFTQTVLDWLLPRSLRRHALSCSHAIVILRQG